MLVFIIVILFNLIDPVKGIEIFPFFKVNEFLSLILVESKRTSVFDLLLLIIIEFNKTDQFQLFGIIYI